MSFAENYITKNKNNFPTEALANIQERLASLSEDEVKFISSIKIKNPNYALFLSIFLGALGMDRFYIGDIILGIAKFFLSWLTFGLWYMIDCFLIYKSTKLVNLESINMALCELSKNKKGQAI